MYAGVLYAPIAPAYSLLAQRPRHARQLVRDACGRAWSSRPTASRSSARLRACRCRRRRASWSVARRPESFASTPFAELEATRRPRAVDEAHARVRPRHDREGALHVGIDRRPKGVINTQRMLCANQELIRTVLPFLRRRAAASLRLAAVEPHLRRQPQLRHRALQRRHALHRRGPADAGRHSDRTIANLREVAADRVLQRAARLRAAAAAPSRGRAFCAALLQPAQDVVLRRRRPAPARSPTSCSGWPSRRRGRPRAVDHRPRRDRERAVRAVHGTAARRPRARRRAGARRRAEGRSRRRRARSAPARSEHHAGLLARRRADARRVRRGGLLPDGRRDRASSIRTIRSTGGFAFRRTARAKTSSSRPAPGSASARCGRASLAALRRYRARRRRSPGTVASEVAVLVFPNLAACRRPPDSPGAALRASSSPTPGCGSAFAERARAFCGRTPGSSTSSFARCCWTSRRRSTPWKSPTRARSTRRRCCATAGAGRAALRSDTTAIDRMPADADTR